MHHDELAVHLEVDRYGDFLLTEAVRPAAHLPVVPREGYRRDTFRDPHGDVEVPVLVASASREKLLDLFLALTDLLGAVVDVVLETSHRSVGEHQDLVRERIDLPVLQSVLLDYEDLLTNDGCTGVAVMALDEPMEVQFDEHKLLVIYAHDPGPFEAALAEAGVRYDPALKLITEGEHLHATSVHHREAFAELCCRLGVVGPTERARQVD